MMFDVEGDFEKMIAYPSSMYSVPSGKSCHKRLPPPLPPFLVELRMVLYTVLRRVSLNDEL